MRKFACTLALVTFIALSFSAPASAYCNDDTCIAGVIPGSSQAAELCRTFAVTNKGRWPMPSYCGGGYRGPAQRGYYGGQSYYGAGMIQHHHGIVGYGTRIIRNYWRRVYGVCVQGICP